MDALKHARQLWNSIGSGPGLPALELADTVSGGHIKDAARPSDELFSAAVDDDTRTAALTGFDLARLNDARLSGVLELLDCILKVQDELAQRWSEYEEARRPELRDLLAASALVATGYARQQSHQRRQVIVDALRGSLCPEPYLWGFQDELLRDLIRSGVTVQDLELLRQTDAESETKLEGKAILVSPEMDSYERLATGGFVVITAQGQGARAFIRTRFEAPPAGNHKFSIRQTHRGSKLLAMIDAGRSLTSERP